ncbi:lipoyl(octanoyl) transferase LipB [bacterium SCSIO 12643]|nr:lipoyl(octanoyl) transferase LipB [bacterium SCSIO 12643]
MPKVFFKDLGKLDYQEAWDFQEEIFKESVELKLKNIKSEQPTSPKNYFFYVEHPHVYTLGKSGSLDNLLLDEQGLEDKEATFYKINRGGDITYHGPGQLVGYPILDLDQFKPDIHLYLRNIEEAVIQLCAEYGIKGERFEKYTGVWIDPGTPQERKICAIGVKTSRWVTMHGFALNVNTNLEYFGNIVPCGIVDKDVTSLQRELGREVDMQEVKDKLQVHFQRIFDMEMTPFNV